VAIEPKEKGIKNITVNATHSGAVASNFGQDSNKGFFRQSVSWKWLCHTRV